MQTITINQRDYYYSQDEIINFSEGLIGLPEMRRAVLIEMNEYEPFCWLASLENENTRFIVVEPDQIFAGYEPFSRENLKQNSIQTLAIVKISSDWQKTTINLRAPIIVNAETKSGSQIILSESNYQFAESLPQN
jgi:flagellar assembly factor FliW